MFYSKGLDKGVWEKYEQAYNYKMIQTCDSQPKAYKHVSISELWKYYSYKITVFYSIYLNKHIL
jgi:hypothetical protein